MKIKEMPLENRPRERFLKQGPESLSDSELFAIILRTGIKGENVVDVSNRLINEYGLDKLFDCSLKELQKIKGIGSSKAMQILTIAELGKRYNQSKNNLKKINSGKDVYLYLREKLCNETQENVLALLLNQKNMIIKEEKITKGILDASIIHPREIFKQAIKNSAAKIIIVHNHPSGDPTPSSDDLEITQKLIDAGDILGIKVLDHIIIAKDEYWSYAERK